MKIPTINLLLLIPFTLLALISLPVLWVMSLFGHPERAFWAIQCLDHFVNAALLNGSPFESVSSHAWSSRDQLWAKVVIKVTSIFQRDHCQKSFESEAPLLKLISDSGLVPSLRQVEDSIQNNTP